MTVFRNAGRTAGRTGKPLWANPHRPGTLARDEWEAGWAEGERGARAEPGAVGPGRGPAGCGGIATREAPG